MAGKIGLIFNGVWSQYALATAPKYANIYDLVYVHDLGKIALDGYDALVIPFQSHQAALADHKHLLYDFLHQGKKVAVFGDSSPQWLENAFWEDRPVNNYWWVADPSCPPITKTNAEHPVFRGLLPRHACWHVHGVYRQIPSHAEVIQSNGDGEVITWETHEFGGTLFVSTLDPIVEHGIQQIRHLDHFVDNLTEWLSGRRPSGKFQICAEQYGVPW
ncbi:MAG: hypothetical protein ACO1RA_16670 [Planctomycetaceae bacterium]